MATFHSGQGGSIIHDPAGVPTTIEGVKDWRLSLTALLAEITNAGSSGIQQWQKVLTGGTWSANVLLDSTNLIDTDVSFGEGDSATLKFNIGDSGKFYQFAGIVETLEVNCPSNEIVVFALSGKINGAVTDPVTNP